MSHHNLNEFDYMAGAGEMEDFIDEIEDENYGGGAADMGLDEYEMVCFLFFCSDYSSCTISFKLF